MTLLLTIAPTCHLYCPTELEKSQANEMIKLSFILSPLTNTTLGIIHCLFFDHANDSESQSILSINVTGEQSHIMEN